MWYTWFEWAVPRVLNKDKPDLFYSPDGYCSLNTTIPTALTIHDLAFEHHPQDVGGLVKKYYQYYTPKFAQKASRIATVSEFSKQDIINQSRVIGTEDFAKTMPEYCGVISQKPTVKAVLSKIEAEETKFDEDIIDRIVASAKVIDIRDIESEMNQQITETETVTDIASGEVVIDVRAPEEEERKPLEIDGVEVKVIPFFKLATQFSDLDKSKTYLLYCERGVMSKLQALYLIEQGYQNVKVYRP